MSSLGFSPPAGPAPDDDMAIDPVLRTNNAPTFRPDPQASLFIDTLARRYHLTKEQSSDLSGLYQLSVSLPGSLSQAEIMGKIYLLACQFATEQRLLHAIQSADSGSQNGVGDLRLLFQELSIRLNDTFHLTKEQKMSIRRLAQELIYKPTRIAFKMLHSDIERKMRAKPELHGMENIFGQLVREAKWTSESKRIASNVRNTFRGEASYIRDSIIGKKRCSVEHFTLESCIRYRQGVKNQTFEQGYLIHNILLRRFAWDNKPLLGCDENEASEENEDASASEEELVRKRKKTVKGRIASGEDFWSKVDSWFKEKVELWGSDFKGDGWKRYVEESLKLDNDRHNASRKKHSASPTGSHSFTSSIPTTTPSTQPTSSHASGSSDGLPDGPAGFIGSPVPGTGSSSVFDVMSAFQ